MSIHWGKGQLVLTTGYGTLLAIGMYIKLCYTWAHIFCLSVSEHAALIVKICKCHEVSYIVIRLPRLHKTWFNVHTYVSLFNNRFTIDKGVLQ